MAEQLRVSKEFLQRALGFGEGGDPHTVGVFPEALPDRFPLTLPELPGLKVLGSVHSMAPHWTFYGGSTSPEQNMWRIFLDVALPLPETMRLFQNHLLSRGWEVVRPFNQTFVEAEQSHWMVVNPAQGWQLDLAMRQETAETGQAQTQVWLTLREIDARSLRHLLGEDGSADHFQAPLPLLRLPAGWRARMAQGQHGAVASEEYQLHAPADAGELWPHLLPQLAAQGWALLHREDGLSLYRTELGSGHLLLEPHRGGVRAVIVHVTTGERSGSHRAGFSLG